MRFLFFTFLFLSTTGFAAVDDALVKKAETYLNSIQNLKGTFSQTASNGAKDSGLFYLSRPGKMRLDYQSPMTVVSDGKQLIYHDKQLDQVTHMSLDATPAGVLFRPHIQLTGKDIVVLKTEYRDGFAEITVGMTNDPGSGSLKMYFKADTFALRGWQIKDASGLVTRVTLNEIKEVGTLSKNLFKISREKTQSIEGTGKPSNGFY